MTLQLFPLLQQQLDIYQTAFGPQRFKEYLDTLRDENGDMELPLSAMNPMGKDHLPQLLQTYIDLGAEEAVTQAIADVDQALLPVDSAYNVALVLADDKHGGWTNRYQYECDRILNGKAELRRGWITILLWSSDPPDKNAVYQATLRTIYRSLYVLQHGWPKTLRAALNQEGYALKAAGIDFAPVSAAQAELIEICLDDTAYDTILSCLFGDAAGATLGYMPLGLEENAGLRYALQTV